MTRKPPTTPKRPRKPAKQSSANSGPHRAKPGRRGNSGGATTVVQGGGASFVASVDAPEQVQAGPPEFAFAGRSNVGKSSLLNALSGHKGLARTSKTPGRTQRINLFDITLSGGVSLRLADLPGYGHARAPGAVRAEFGPMIERYVIGQPRLRAVFLLVDARRDPDADAIDFTLWLQERGVRVELIVTKIDKIPKNQRFGTLEKLKRAHFLQRRPMAISSLSGEGVEELRAHLVRLSTP